MIEGDKEFLPNAEATAAFGRALAKDLKQGSCVALVGELGAGKTHLTQGIVLGLGASESVTSPTFSLVQEYQEGSLPVYHFDFYRLKSEQDLDTMGWDDYLDGSGIVIVEWANLFPEVMPQDTIWLELQHQESGRLVTRRG